MLRVLDPHSNFFDPKSYSALREEQRGKYYGVGMQVGPRNNKVIVIAPFAGAPAYRAGIRPGDVIIAVDGKPTDNMSTSDVAELLKGPKGTTVKITMLREGTDKPLDFSVVRDEIPRYSVDVHFMIRPGIGYMHVSGFQETTEHEVAEALDELGDLQGLDPRSAAESRRPAERRRRRGRQVPEEGTGHRFASRARLGREGLQGSARQRRQGLSAGGAGESRNRFGG